MQFSEKELETWIFNSHPDELSDKGFQINLSEHHKKYRQIELGCYGRLDIITIGKDYEDFPMEGTYPHLIINIIELKIQKITADDIDQVLRYKYAVEEILKNKNKINSSREINCYLVGPEIQSGHFISNVIEDLYLVEYSFNLSGFQFKTNSGGWRRGDGGLKYGNIKHQFTNTSNHGK